MKAKAFFSPSWQAILPPVLLVLFAVLPILILRYTLYALLATPLLPLIYRLGWVYRDKPMFLTGPAAVLAAVIWAIVLYLVLCLFRYIFTR